MIHKIQFTRQHDGMFISAKTTRDLTDEVQEHYKLLLKLRKGCLSNAEHEEMAELEQFIIDNIDFDTKEEHGVIPNIFTTPDNITMLCC